MYCCVNLITHTAHLTITYSFIHRLARSLLSTLTLPWSRDRPVWSQVISKWSFYHVVRQIPGPIEMHSPISTLYVYISMGKKHNRVGVRASALFRLLHSLNTSNIKSINFINSEFQDIEFQDYSDACHLG